MNLIDFLRQFREAVPHWIADFDPNRPIAPAEAIRHLLQSRTVYYPGSYIDGGPVAAFNSAHAAHCFIYVDYLLERETLLNRIRWERGRGFRGYDSVAQIDLAEEDFRLGRWVRHYHRPVVYRTEPIRPYGLISIFERRQGYDDNHGAQRFAILFLAADGHATFDAIFCQNNGTPAPFCAVIQCHGFGGDWDNQGFGAGGPMAQIAAECGVFPQFHLKDVNEDVTPAWPGYARCHAPDGTEVGTLPMGMHRFERSLWERRPA